MAAQAAPPRGPVHLSAISPHARRRVGSGCGGPRGAGAAVGHDGGTVGAPIRCRVCPVRRPARLRSARRFAAWPEGGAVRDHPSPGPTRPHGLEARLPGCRRSRPTVARSAACIKPRLHLSIDHRLSDGSCIPDASEPPNGAIRFVLQPTSRPLGRGSTVAVATVRGAPHGSLIGTHVGDPMGADGYQHSTRSRCPRSAPRAPRRRIADPGSSAGRLPPVRPTPWPDSDLSRLPS